MKRGKMRSCEDLYFSDELIKYLNEGQIVKDGWKWVLTDKATPECRKYFKEIQETYDENEGKIVMI